MASRRSDIGPFGTQREEKSSAPGFTPNRETIDLGEFQTAGPSAPAWEGYWKTDPGGGFNPMKGFLANIWDMARDPVYFASGADQNAFEKTAALAYNSFLSTVSAGYLEGRHLTAPENKTLQSFAQALGTMAGFAAMLAGPTKLISFLKVAPALRPVVTGAVYGFGKKTGYGMDGFLSHDDIAARFKGAVMDGGMFAGFHFASKGLGAALSKAAPGAIRRAPGTMGAIQHGIPFGAFEAGMTAYEGGDTKEMLARGLGGFMGGGVFGAAGGRRGAKPARALRETLEPMREGDQWLSDRMGREATALEPERVREQSEFLGEYIPAKEYADSIKTGLPAVIPGREPVNLDDARVFGDQPPKPIGMGGIAALPERGTASRYKFTEAEGYDIEAGEAGEWRGMALDLLSKHKQSKRGQKQAFQKSLMRARRELFNEVRKHPDLMGRAGDIVNEAFRQEIDALAIVEGFEAHKEAFAKEFKATGIPEPVVREGVGRRVERQTSGDIRSRHSEVRSGELEGTGMVRGEESPPFYDMFEIKVHKDGTETVEYKDPKLEDTGQKPTLSAYRAARSERKRQPTESEPVSRGTVRTGEIPGLKATFTEDFEALEAQDLVKQKQLRNALLFDLERQGIEVRGDETVTELDRMLGNVPDVVKDEPVKFEKQEVPTGKETKRMKQARALADGRTFFVGEKEYSIEEASITDTSLRLTSTEGDSVLVENYKISGRGRKQAISGDGVEAVPGRPPGSIMASEAETRTRVPGKTEEGEAKSAAVSEKVGKAPEYRKTEDIIESLYQGDLKSDTPGAKQRLASVKARGRTLLQENKALEPKRAAELAKDAVYAERADRLRTGEADAVSLEKDRIAKLEATVEGLDQQRKDAEEQRRIREQKPDEEEPTEGEISAVGEEHEVATELARTKTQQKKIDKIRKAMPGLFSRIETTQEGLDGKLNGDLHKEMQNLGFKGQELSDLYYEMLEDIAERTTGKGQKTIKDTTGTQPGELSGVERPTGALEAIETGIGQDALSESLSMQGMKGATPLVRAEMPEAAGKVSSIYPDPSRIPGGEVPTIGKREIVSQDITQAERGQMWRDPATGEMYLNVFETRIQKDGKTWIPEPTSYDSTASSGAEAGAWLSIHINQDGTLGPRGVRAIKADDMRAWDNLGRQSPEMESTILENVSDEYSRVMHRQQGISKVGSTGEIKRAAGRGKRIGVKQTARQAAAALKEWQKAAYKAGSLDKLNRVRAEVGLDPLAELPKAHDRRRLDEDEMTSAFGIKPDGTLYAGQSRVARDPVTGEKLTKEVVTSTDAAGNETTRTAHVYEDPTSRTPMETGIEDLRSALDLQGRGGERPVGRFAESPREVREFSRHPEETRDPRTIGEEFTPEQILENLMDYGTWYEKNVGKKKEQFAEIDREAERETTQQEREQIAGDFNVHERAMYDEMVGEYVDVMAEMGERVSEVAAREVVLEAMVEGKIPPELEAYLKNRC